MHCNHSDVFTIKCGNVTECVQCIVEDRENMKKKLEAASDAAKQIGEMKNIIAALKVETEALKKQCWPPRDVPIFDILYNDCLGDWREDNIGEAKKIFGNMKYDDLPADPAVRLGMFAKLMAFADRSMRYFVSNPSKRDIARTKTVLNIAHIDMNKYVRVGRSAHRRIVDIDHPLLSIFGIVDNDGYIDDIYRPCNYRINSLNADTIADLWDVLSFALSADTTGDIVRELKAAIAKMAEI